MSIGKRHPETRSACSSSLEEQLRQYHQNNPTLNGFLVGYLLDLNAVEALETIRSAYQQQCVDLSIAGDCEEAEIELGVRDVRTTPPPRTGLFGHSSTVQTSPSAAPTSPAQAAIPAGKKNVG